MSVLLLRLAGPLQSWGQSSRFRRRDSARWPTKSGVLGLVAAAKGLRRTDPIEDLLALSFGVRVDAEGKVLTDFHTVHNSGPDKPPTVSYRDYLADATFVAALQGERQLIEALTEALERPKFPLYLGRRSCPVEGQLVMGVVEDEPLAALAGAPWQARVDLRRRQPLDVQLDVYLDSTDFADQNQRDVPISYDPTHREYGWRAVKHERVTVANPDGREGAAGLVDWFAGLGA